MVRPLKMGVLLLSLNPLLHLHPTHRTDLPTYLPLPQLVIVLTFKSKHLHHDSLSNGPVGACSSAGFPGNQWASLTSILPLTGNLPFPPEWRLPPCPARRPPLTVGCRSKTLLHTSKLPHPLNHWCLCHRLWAVYSVLKLGNYRACRPAWCSQTVGGAARRQRRLPRERRDVGK